MPATDHAYPNCGPTCQSLEHRNVRLEAVLTAARPALKDLRPGTERHAWVAVWREDLEALGEAVRAADAQPPTERAESHGGER